MAANDNRKKALAAKKQRLLECLLMGKNVKDAAEEVDISERQAHRWVREEEFLEHLREAEEKSLSTVLRRLTKSAATAIDTLERNLGVDVAAGTQVRAALGLLDQFAKFRQLHDIEDRLQRLEVLLADQLNKQQGGQDVRV